jgi:hypothetical protein
MQRSQHSYIQASIRRLADSQATRSIARKKGKTTINPRWGNSQIYSSQRHAFKSIILFLTSPITKPKTSNSTEHLNHIPSSTPVNWITATKSMNSCSQPTLEQIREDNTNWQFWHWIIPLLYYTLQLCNNVFLYFISPTLSFGSNGLSGKGLN